MSFRILTFNTWGTPYAKHHTQRMTAIASRILELAPDVIALQEMYRESDRQRMTNALQAVYPYQHYFASGLLGSGLMTFSRFPISDAVFYRFRMAGKPEKFWRGDYFAGKGIGLTRVETADGPVNVFNCHTHAQYEDATDNEYAAYTNSNLYETARLVHRYADSPTILCGDLNTRPDRLGYRLVTQLAALDDAYALTYPGETGYTFHQQNPYVASKSERLDYILLHGLRANTIDITLTEKLTEHGAARAYSDHYGLLAGVEITDPQTQKIAAYRAGYEVLAELLGALQQTRAAVSLEQHNASNRSFLSFAAIADTLLLSRERNQQPAGFARFLHRWLFVALMFYGVGNAAHSFLSLKPRAAALDALIAELEHQINGQRLFNGQQCSE